MRRGRATLSRIELALAQSAVPDPQLEEIKRGLEQRRRSKALSDSWSPAYEKSSRATQEQLASTMSSLKDALEMLNVSMEQGNSLYRNIVKKMFDERSGGSRRGPRSSVPRDRMVEVADSNRTSRAGGEGVRCAAIAEVGHAAWSSAARARTRSSPWS